MTEETVYTSYTGDTTLFEFEWQYFENAPKVGKYNTY